MEALRFNWQTGRSVIEKDGQYVRRVVPLRPTHTGSILANPCRGTRMVPIL